MRSASGIKKTAYINEATEYAAAMDIVLSYHSLQDDYEDDGSHIKQAISKALKKIIIESASVTQDKCRR